MSKRKISNKELSIDHDDDRNDYNEFSKFLEEHTERQKRKTASEIIEMGDDYLAEIEHKKKVKQEEKKPYIKFILKKIQ